MNARFIGPNENSFRAADDNQRMNLPLSASGTELLRIDGAVRLDHLGVMRAQGADAASFLHSQLTQDFKVLGLSQARLAAYLSPKGRMLASFVAFRRPRVGDEDESVWLVTDRSTLPASLKRLSMFVLRSKARLSDAGDALSVVGLAGSAADGLLESAGSAPWSKLDRGDASVVRLPQGNGQSRALWVGPAAQSQELLASLAPISSSLWSWLEVRSGVARIQAETVDQFVPQMLNYELVGGVDFQKGCYPGQEIVARSQYRGTVKRRSFLVHGDEAMTPGQEVFWQNDPAQPCGIVAASAANPQGGFDAVAELKLAALDGATLHLGSPGGPILQLLDLPYAVPRDAAAA
jgi:folate-binding protein YgfZ